MVAVGIPSAAAPLFGLAGGGTGCATLAEAFARYTTLAMPHHTSVAAVAVAAAAAATAGNPAMQFISVTVGSMDEAPPQLTTDETYEVSLYVDPPQNVHTTWDLGFASWAFGLRPHMGPI